MGRTSYSSLRDFLNPDDSIPDHARPAMQAFMHLASIVAWVTRDMYPGVMRTNVFCRRSHRGVRCTGVITAVYETAQARIFWQCPVCGEQGYIDNWEHTPWDRRDGAHAGPTMN